MSINPWRTAAILFIFSLLVASTLALRPSGSAAAAPPSPSPTPTNPPTPYMPLEQIPNGAWDVIEQTYFSVTYTHMTLKETGDAVTGTWIIDKKTAYVLDGSRQGAHLSLQIKASTTPDAAVIGKMEADIDGIADMVGSITLGSVVVAFQGAQHGRVPPPVDNTQSPEPNPSPY